MHRADVQGMVTGVADRARKPSHMDVDQFALASMGEDQKEGVAAFWKDEAIHGDRNRAID